ncbi:MerR family transcriptional regulator [Gulosibacter sp. 10]|uniref:MerR family transcriptional regulator n=1 Tax=Gulosibacter sp. 10 TaxID=1255570 RepID=UPI00097F670C|nr:MerR family transcriptional regulator [Gulosibacter sp. 10]SJM68211.1 transcriptional regulator [Gulosibacter sp. 10]
MNGPTHEHDEPDSRRDPLLGMHLPVSMTPHFRVGRSDGHEPSPEEELTVGAAASLVGVSIRALHHWDDLGIASPSGRTPAGYRLYSAEDVERIHRILVYRELGFGLAKIGALLDDPDVDEAEQLRSQQRLLDERIEGLRRMSDAVAGLLRARERGRRLTAREQAEIFGRGWRADWAEEAHERWGGSEQWAEFERNAAHLDSEDRDGARRLGEALYRDLAEAKRAGVRPGSEAAHVLAERHRALIGRFFECTHPQHVVLGRLFVQDERFTAQFDELEPGLSRWLHDAIAANARRRGVNPDEATWAGGSTGG